MIQKLETALNKLSQLSESEQESIAALILAEIEDEIYWDEQFSRSKDVLAELADEALTELKQGKTQPLNFS